VEANPLRAELVDRAQAWKWSSLGCDKKIACRLLHPWPADRRGNWTALVNRPLGEPQRQQIKTSLERDRPLGSDKWTRLIAEMMGISYNLNPRGRPKKLEAL
jgi:putative transposase